MLKVNKMVHDAHEAVSLLGLGENLDGNMAEVGVRELNRLVTDLNAQSYIAQSQTTLELPGSRNTYYIKVLTDAERLLPHTDTVDAEPPEAVVAVGRKVGVRQVPLHSIDFVQLHTRNRGSVATSWNYQRVYEPIPDDPDGNQREVGVITLDGTLTGGGVVYANAKIPQYTLDSTIYLSDLYNELLLSGLELYLCDFHKLDNYRDRCETRFNAAKRLIKRNNATQRMLQWGAISGSYMDNYDNGMAGYGW